MGLLKPLDEVRRRAGRRKFGPRDQLSQVGQRSQAGRKEVEMHSVQKFRAHGLLWAEGRKSFPLNVPLHLLHAARHRPSAFGLN